MAPKRQPQVAPPIIGNKTTIVPSQKSTTTTSTTTTSSSTTLKTKGDALAYSTIVQDIWASYQRTTPHSLKLIDLFMAFLVFTGVVQFAYCLLVGNYPFNAFLSGFIATVGQFVLAGTFHTHPHPKKKKQERLTGLVVAGLRSQCNIANTTEFPKVTPERYDF